MKCQAMVKPHKTGKKATCKYLPWLIPEGTILPPDIAEGTEVCGGTIIATIGVEGEPTWGDTYYKLDVKFTCSRCGNEWHEGLPDEYTINEFLTKIVEGL